MLKAYIYERPNLCSLAFHQNPRYSDEMQDQGKFNTQSTHSWVLLLSRDYWARTRIPWPDSGRTESEGPKSDPKSGGEIRQFTLKLGLKLDLILRTNCTKIRSNFGPNFVWDLRGGGAWHWLRTLSLAIHYKIGLQFCPQNWSPI